MTGRRLLAQSKELAQRPPLEEFAGGYFQYTPPGTQAATAETLPPSELPEFEP